MRTAAVAVLVAGLAGPLAGSARAASAQFDFADPKGVNAMVIVLDSLTEPITGFAGGVAGVLTLDPADPKTVAGSLTVPADRIAMPVPRMTEVLHSADWLDVKAHPAVSFEFREILSVARTAANGFRLAVRGDFTCHGVTRPLEVPVDLVFLPGAYKDRNHKGEGDLLVLRTQFTIRRTDFGIKPEVPSTVVANDIQVQVRIVGGTPQKP
jgi:polyisoprenoid-binding protein YceI